MAISIIDIKPLSEKEYINFRDLIYKTTGISLKDAKQEMVNSRLLKRLKAMEIPSFGEYYDYLVNIDDGTELMEMINSITTNKTDFFRENNHFEFMSKILLPRLKEECYRTGDLSIRVWSSACSTGEEPYTINMVLKEFFKNNTGWDIKILASDLDTNVLTKAMEGIYSEQVVSDIPINLLREYFYKGEGQNEGLFKVKDKLKNNISFRKINLINNSYPIDTPLDIIFCRNVFIYFDQSTINAILNRFYNVLKPGGHLFIGHSESIDVNEMFKGRFKLVDHTVYIKL